jgi:hypothetical protein
MEAPMEVSAKNWFTLLAMVQSLKMESDLRGTQISMLLETLQRSGALSREHVAELEKAMNDLAEHLLRQEVSMQEQQNPQETARRVDLRESGVIARPPAVLGEHLQSDFDQLMDQALLELRKAQGR